MSYTLPCASAAVAAPKTIMVMLHGYGANGLDLINLAPLFQQHFPSMLILAPDAPLSYPGNFAGRAWFDLEDFSPEAIIRGTQAATPGALEFLESVATHHEKTLSDLIILGFSQGTMMALQALLHLEQPLGAVIGFSGLLAQRNPQARAQPLPPVQLIHGDQDPVVPEVCSREAEKQLRALGCDVRYHCCHGLAHSINDEGLQSAIDFLISKKINGNKRDIAR